MTITPTPTVGGSTGADPDLVVLGGSVAGLGTALFAARAGLSVTVVDRDPAAGEPAPPDGEHRRSTPQARHSHIFLARLRLLLAARAPDVLDRLVAAGVRELALRDGLPPALADRDDPLLDDVDLVVLAARRTTLEGALRAAVLDEPGVTVRAGSSAIGVAVDLVEVLAGGPPRVRGVHLDDGTVLRAALTVDATGRRTPVPAWLDGVGGTPALEVSDCGIAYLTRFHRLHAGAEPLRLDRGFTAGASYDRYSCLVFPGDAGTFSVTFGVLPEDRALRGLSHDDAFTAAVRAIPMLAPWLDPDRSEVTSDVATMTGLKNRIRRWVVDGRPVALGVASVGDAAATTNPAHSRGTALAMVHAAATVDAVVAHHGDAAALAHALDDVVSSELEPWVRDSVAQDEARLATWRAGPGSALPPTPSRRLTNGEAYAAAQHDPVVWHAFSRLQQLLVRPDDVLADPAMVARVRSRPTPGPAVTASPGRGAPAHDELAALVADAGGAVRRRGQVAATA